jgi:hypothetical protein
MLLHVEEDPVRVVPKAGPGFGFARNLISEHVERMTIPGDVGLVHTG